MRSYCFPFMLTHPLAQHNLSSFVTQPYATQGFADANPPSDKLYNTKHDVGGFSCGSIVFKFEAAKPVGGF